MLDGIRPDVLQAAIREGDAPNLGALAQRGEAVWDAVSVFPSITPAATAAIATGEAPARSGIVGHAWYDEDERRVVVYGAMTETVMASGPIRVFHNNVWRMNRDDLHAATLFEALHDRGFDGACVNFPVRRGPHTHPIRMKTVEGYLIGGRYLGPSVQGPKEYFMGDLFYSRDTGFSGRKANGGVLRSVGINDDYAARVGAMLLKERAAPFNLVYFFKGDSIAHHHGLEAQRQWLVTADEYVARIFTAGGGVERMLEDYAVLALSDHGHAPLLPKGRYVDLRMIPGQNVSSGVKARFGNGTTVVVVPNGRSALLYLRGDVELESVVEKLAGRRGVDLAAWMEDGWVAVHRLGREIRFKPGSGPKDPFGRSWEFEGDPRALDLTVSGGFLYYGEYPDALERLWGCLHSPRCGDVVLSATPGYTFGEISGGYHTASDHGSLHMSDSNVFVLASGVPAPHRITDVAPTLLSHFGAGKVSEDRVLQ
ncbi:MAG: alkaline phosphatase family protein [Rubrobacteraceae bacterium]|nr:alkaline phosphatase family protein [Rubrobacteraceae bacterium]